MFKFKRKSEEKRVEIKYIIKNIKNNMNILNDCLCQYNLIIFLIYKLLRIDLISFCLNLILLYFLF